MAILAKYNKFLLNQNNGVAPINFESDTIKVAITTSDYVPSATSHVYFSDVTNEVTGTNYSSGGTAIGSKTVTENAGVVTFDGDDVTWFAHLSGFSDGRYGIVYKSTGTASNSPLFGYIDFITDKGNVGGDLTIQWNATGIATWQ
jgi:hypothetical protein